MEIPAELKTLYAHWDKHANFNHQAVDRGIDIDQTLVTKIMEFAAERMNVWEKKFTGQPKPYTNDPILANFRFCNIYRELDAQTIQIHRDLLPLKDDFNLWLLNLMLHRFVCRPQTVQLVGHLSFDEKENDKVMERLLKLPSPKYGTAYVFPISVIQRSEYPSRELFFCKYLPKITPEVAELINEFEEETVNSALTKILPVFGFNFKFHWTEILIDIAYQFPDKINLFRDFHIGPGALPTLKALGGDHDLNEVLNKLTSLTYKGFPYLTFNGKPVLLSAENWEGIGCEYRKYSNLMKGEGRKRKY